MLGEDELRMAPKLIDSFLSDEGQPMLVMEAADPNGDLPRYIQINRDRSRADESGLFRRTLAQRFLACVNALHSKHLVHCDIKPKHFLRFGGEWKLIDYDSVLEEGDMQRPNCTLKYAPPELVRASQHAEPLAVSSSMDVWALGLVLYEFMTGYPIRDDLSSKDEDDVEAHVSVKHVADKLKADKLKVRQSRAFPPGLQQEDAHENPHRHRHPNPGQPEPRRGAAGGGREAAERDAESAPREPPEHRLADAAQVLPDEPGHGAGEARAAARALLLAHQTRQRAQDPIARAYEGDV